MFSRFLRAKLDLRALGDVKVLHRPQVSISSPVAEHNPMTGGRQWLLVLDRQAGKKWNPRRLRPADVPEASPEAASPARVSRLSASDGDHRASLQSVGLKWMTLALVKSKTTPPSHPQVCATWSSHSVGS